ncbi:NAD(P)-binding domain-containing protein [uncultured Selenomonas sp.]|uniref:NAD(P)H-dependent glycerol-3-phosphate dehydrogenase n=1 Tax=uncultured Selenomonas sp. TaxID=159275 RepID=UPI0025F4BCA2|nr:NAD(P)-binding domain-containing protein [uncultured Selenomonas sp.]
MARIAVIGAGAMGSAFCQPLADNGNDVRLWGTHLDDHIIDELKAGRDHPKHKYPLPKAVQPFYHREFADAVKDAEMIVMAVTSDALGSVFEQVASCLRPGMIVGSVSKGFDYDQSGAVALLPNILEERLPAELHGKIDFVFVAGPCKAVEVLWKVPTSVTYASRNIEAAKKLQKVAQTDVYNIDVTTDVIGTETCAAMKNAYCVGLGMAEGFPKQKGGFLHKNTKGALFTYAVQEMGLLSQALGGTWGPVLGLPGIGDLELTGEAGRNRTLGEVLGGGKSATDAVKEMREKDITVEGYPAIRFGWELVQALAKEEKIKLEELPLLAGLYRILYEDIPSHPEIKRLVALCTEMNLSDQRK